MNIRINVRIKCHGLLYFNRSRKFQKFKAPRMRGLLSNKIGLIGLMGPIGLIDLKFDLRDFFFCCVLNFEKFTFLETEHSGDYS